MCAARLEDPDSVEIWIGFVFLNADLAMFESERENPATLVSAMFLASVNLPPNTTLADYRYLDSKNQIQKLD